MKNLARFTALIASCLAATSLSVHAVSGTWNGTTTGTWDTTATNWSGVSGTPWDSTNGLTNDATFNTASLAASVSGTVYANGITFSTTGALSSGNITLAGTTPFISVAASQNGTIGSALLGSAGLTKTGNGTLILSGTNTYTGNTTINGGFIQVSGITNTLGSGSTGTVNLNGGGIIASAGAATLTEAWSINAGASGGTIQLSGTSSAGRFGFTANKLTGSGTLLLQQTTNNGGRFIGAATQTGFTGKWIIDGTNSNFFALTNGGNNFGAGSATDTITLINNGQIAGANNNSSTALVGSATQGVVVGSGGGKLGASGTHILTVAGAISSTGTDQVQIAGNGNTGAGVKFTNTGNSYSGDTSVFNAAGGNTTTMQLGASEVLPNGAGKGNLLLGSSGVLDMSGFNETINGLTGSAGSYVVNSNSTASTLTIGDNGTSSTFAGVIQDTVGTVAVANDATGAVYANNTGGTTAIVKTGSGTLTLSGNNSYSGGTTLNNGTLAISGSGKLGSTGGSLNVAGGTLDLGGTTQTVGAVTINSTLQNGTLSGTSFDGQNGTVSAALSGSGALAKTTTGTLTLSGNSSYSGGTTVSAGSLVVGNNNALGSGNVTLNSSNGTNSGVYRSSLTLSGVTVTGKTVTMNSTTNRAGLVATGAGGGTWNGTVTLSGSTSGNGNSEFTNVSGNGPLTVLGTVNGSFTSGGLTLRGDNAFSVLGATVSIGSTPITKTDPGTWKITSSGNTWGTTTVSMGTLVIGASDALPTTSNLSMAAPTKLDLGGSYSLGGSRTGTLSLTGNATIDFGTAGTAQSLVFGDSHSASWGSFTLTINNWQQGTDILRFGTTSAGLTSGQLANINFTGYTGAQIDSSGYVTAVPEPATWALLAFSLTTVVVLRRRKSA